MPRRVCTTPPGPPAQGEVLPSNGWKDGDGSEEGQLQGVLQEEQGCLVLRTPDDFAPEILWPAGWTRTEDGEGVAVRRRDGTVAVRVGERLVGAGSVFGEPGCTRDGTVSLTDDLR